MLASYRTRKFVGFQTLVLFIELLYTFCPANKQLVLSMQFECNTTPRTELTCLWGIETYHIEFRLSLCSMEYDRKVIDLEDHDYFVQFL